MVTDLRTEAMIFAAMKRPVVAPVVVVCGWCPDSEGKTATARAQGHEVSHGMCSVCSARFENLATSK